MVVVPVIFTEIAHNYNKKYRRCFHNYGCDDMKKKQPEL